MRRIVLSKKSAQIVDAGEPVLKDGWVTVELKAIPICGSDKWSYYGDNPDPNAGHEGAGVILESRSPRWTKGDRIVLWPGSSCGKCRECSRGDDIYCRHHAPWQGHFCERLSKPAHNCMPLPDDVSFEVGAMACCALGPAFGASHTLRLQASDTLLVTGLGPVGLGAVVVGKFVGARVIGVEVTPWRRDKAKQLGADVVIDPGHGDALKQLQELTRGYGVEQAYDCSGSGQAQRLCLNAVGVRGCVAFIGENHNEFAVKPSPDFIRKGLTVFGSWHYNRNDYPAMAELLRRSPAVQKLISHTFPFAEAQHAFDTFFESGTAAKVVLTL